PPVPEQRLGHRRSTRELVRYGAVIGLLLLTAVGMLAPVYYMAVVANQADPRDLSPVWFHGFHLWDNLQLIWTDTYQRQLLNSMIMSGAIATIDVVAAGMAGYALATMRFRGRSLLFAVVVATLALAPVAVVVPVYVMVYRLGWLNSYPGLIVPG